jgi:hypothetical protein
MLLREFCELVAKDPVAALERLDGSAELLESAERTVADYERRYGMSSEVMYGRLMAGEIREDRDVCKWLFDARTLGRIPRVQSR